MAVSTQVQQDSMTRFMHALKSKDAKRQYPRRFKVFLDYLKLDGPIYQQATDFLLNAKHNPQWIEERFMVVFNCKE
ncbi:MAG: hypothetical protein ACJ71E_03620 [Nitrososphaeraceae archaeon]